MNRILVVPYDPQWVEAFTKSSREIAEAMHDNPIEIHHIGSTSFRI